MTATSPGCRFGWPGTNCTGRAGFSDPSAVVLHLLSRPLLESQVRQRVSAVDNVEFLDGHDFVEPIAPNATRDVSGAARRQPRTPGRLEAG